MKIAILGHGKMGRLIDRLATEAGHEIVLRSTAHSTGSDEALAQADVAIEFTHAEAALPNYRRSLRLGVPIVSGTTGWLDSWSEWIQELEQQQGAFFYASNFSLGVNLLFALNRQLARYMNEQPDYRPLLTEIHHTAKRDAPSGTAISLAEEAIDRVDRLDDWRLVDSGAETEADILPIESLRIDPTPGTHSLRWSSAIDELEIRHVAHSREGFARGALAAAEWLPGKTGVFGMKDLLELP